MSEPCSPLRWKPSPGSLLCHLAYDSPIKPMYPFLPITNARKSEDKRGLEGMLRGKGGSQIRSNDQDVGGNPANTGVF